MVNIGEWEIINANVKDAKAQLSQEEKLIMTNSSNRWTLTVEQDEFSKDFYIILPDELLEKMEWEIGDALKMDIIKMGIEKSLQITKKDE